MPTIIHFNVTTGERTEREMTAEEIAQLPKLSQADKKAAIQAQINEAESRTLMNRATREFMLRLSEKEAAEQGVTPEQLYAVNDAYKAVKDVDAQISVLRAQMKGIK